MRYLADYEKFLSPEEDAALLQATARTSLRLRASQSIAAKWVVWLTGVITVVFLSDTLPLFNLLAWLVPILLLAEVNLMVCRRVLSGLDDASSAQIHQRQWWLWWMTVMNQVCIGSTVWWFGQHDNLTLAVIGTLLQLVYLGAAMSNAATHPLTFVTGAWINLSAVIAYWGSHGSVGIPLSLGLIGMGLMLMKLSKQMALNLYQSVQMRFENQELLKKLEEEKKLAEEATQFKSDFLSNISHEIRTPLGAITGMSYLLAKSHINQQQRDQIQVIEQCSRHLLNLVNQVLDFSKVEAGMLQLDCQLFGLSSVLSNIQAIHEETALSKGLILKFDIHPQIPNQLMGDPLRLTEILVNFVGNGIKFTDHGSVELSVKPEVQEQGRICLHFSVADTGIGVAPEQVGRLFESFSQADAATTRHYGGTGLGLAISKKLVQLMAGDVGVETQQGEGSTFWCRVWFDLPPPAPSPSDALMSAIHADLVNAGAASELKSKKPDAVPSKTVDFIQNSKFDGPQSSLEIESKQPRPMNCPCVRLAWLVATDNPLAVQWLEQHSETMAAHLGSAFDMLAQAIRQFDFSKATLLLANLGYYYTVSQAGLLSEEENKLASKPTILVVDDTPVNLSLMVDLLSSNYKVKVSISGERALAIAAQQPPPDLILLDIMMPKLDGFQTIEKLKQQMQTIDIPVIFLTAKNQLEDEEKGLQLGAVDFITKPISPPIVLERIRTQLTLKAARDFLKDKSEYLEQEVLRRTTEVNEVQAITILTVASLAETRDNETGQHILRTQRYVKALARELQTHPKFQTYLTDTQINLLFLSAPLHDIGKVGIPDRILLKPERLTAEEMEIMKTHTTIGRDSIESAERRLGHPVPFLACAKEIAYSHQEKWDGSGYPQGLKEEEIPISARLMAVADVYDALISRRVYKPAIPHEQAVQMMLQQRGKHFDPDITDAFVRIHDRFQQIAMAHADKDVPTTTANTASSALH